MSTMTVPVLHEPARGCGYRKPGGLYLVSGDLLAPCHKLPIELSVCPTCNQGVKPARGWSWVNFDAIVQPAPHDGPSHANSCVLSRPGQWVMEDGRVGLIWIGESFYKNTAAFMREAKKMGVSRRLHNIPRGFEAGKTLVLLAHRMAISEVTHAQDGFKVAADPLDAVTDKDLTVEFRPGIFSAFIPERVEYVLKPSEERDQEVIQRYRDRGIEPVIVRPV